MAPESERANCPTSKRTGVGDCGEDMRINGVHHSCKLSDDHEGAHECDCAPAPTLTCSEVVERLPEEPYVDWGVLEQAADYLNHAGGGPMEDRLRLLRSQIDSWRERRVQELPVLEKFGDEIAMHGGFGLTIGQLENLRAALVSAIGKATYPRNSEQIRKGAKHE